jgi:hypothetical protein
MAPERQLPAVSMLWITRMCKLKPVLCFTVLVSVQLSAQATQGVYIYPNTLEGWLSSACTSVRGDLNLLSGPPEISPGLNIDSSCAPILDHGPRVKALRPEFPSRGAIQTCELDRSIKEVLPEEVQSRFANKHMFCGIQCWHGKPIRVCTY